MEPIAVVGLDLKFPGDATDPNAFFDMLMSKRSALKEIPKDRFNLDAFSHPDPERAGTLHIRNAHFLKEDIAAFDAPFFSITSAEAAGMDPQQRGLLESTYRALENAGMSLSEVNGSDAGVFIGCFTREYEAITFKDPELNLRYFATGMGTTMLANRLSFFYDLHGPSRECSWAIVGGCNLFYSPDTVIPLTSLGFLSPEGKCYSFDHRANGYSRGEGFGVLMLKRFADAIRDGDTIRAIIRGSSSNQDGKSPSITQPTPQAQMDLINTAYKNAGLGLEHTRYFEAHGTGTPVGDPIEARAIGGVFSQHRSREEPMYVGALKTNSWNVGSSHRTSILERGIIPPNINFEKPNPKIPVDEWGIKFPTDACFWPSKGLRRASINAFGYGGSNAHVILDDALHYMASLGLTGNHRTVEYPIPVALDDAANGSNSAHANSHTSITAKKRIFVFSSFDEAGAERLASTYAEHLKQIKLAITEEQTYLDDLSYTLSLRRSVFPWKFSAIADNLSALIEALESKPSPIRVAAEPKLGLVFTGQGAQWYAMGRELLPYPVFEQSLAAADKFLRGLGCSWSLREELLKEQRASAIDNPAYSQPICTALQVALVELLKYSDVKYSAVIGHSSGELGAAYATGAISCESAWKLSYFRGILSAKLAETSDGTMMAVGLNQEDAISYIEKTMSFSEKGTIVVACVNSLCNVTVSGKSSSIALLKAALDRESIRNQQLRVENAYHSPYMETIADTYRDSIQNIHAGELVANVSFYSSLTGTLLPLSELQDPNYWVQNLVSPVLFSQALTHMLSGTASKTRKLRLTAKVSPITELLEVGPHSALRGPIREITERGTKKLDVAYESLLRRDLPADTTTLSAIGWLHCRGHNVKLGRIDENASANLLVDLPSYPFNHTQSYWNESRLSKGYRFRNAVRHELLGAPVPDWNPKNAIWRNYIRVSESPWVKDHRITGSTIYPAAGMLVMAIEAARQVANSTGRVKGFRIRDVSKPTFGSVHVMRFQARRVIPGMSFIFRVLRTTSGESIAGATLSQKYEIQACPVDAGLEEALFAKTCTNTIGSVEDASTQEVSFKQMYEHLSTVGLDFGPAFQTMRNIRHGYNHEAVATIVASDIAGKMPHGYVQPHLVHPTTLDGILQSIILALTKGGRDVNQVMVPSEIRDLWISAGPEAHFRSVKVAVQAKFLSIRQAEASITCLDNESFRPTATVDGFQVTQVAKNEGSEESVRRLCFNIDWKPDPSYFTQETANTLIGNLEGSGEVARMRRLIEDVETICFLYIKRYLNSHPNPDVIGCTEPHHKKYVEWMKYQANRFDVGEMPHGQRVWLDQASDESHIVAMEERLESSSAEGKLCVAVGRALPDILAGRADALALMFNDKLVENVYRYGAGAEIGYERMNMYIDTLAHKNPALKILEIGAGTGGATKPLLQCLTSHGDNEKGTPRFSRYDFTDISIGFFEKAKEMFAETADRMTFRALNAEGDLTQQGFDKEQYDVIIAANVVHATKNLEATLSNVRKTMKPGGKLILYEMTNTHMIRTGFAFGLLPGWWLSDEDFR
ncbi:MAG: Type I Iterative PKS [Bathelium mastoideum]|nr:MAG: Type I Iterative PKS [Bathelium mastoideum]